MRCHCYILPTPRSNLAKGRSLALARATATRTDKLTLRASYMAGCRSHHRASFRRYRSSNARSWALRPGCVVNRVAFCDGPHCWLVGHTRYRSIRDETTRRWHYLPVYRCRGHDAASGCRSRYGVRLHFGCAWFPGRADGWLARVRERRAATTGEACALKPFRRTVGSSRESVRARSRRLTVLRSSAVAVRGVGACAVAMEGRSLLSQ